MSQDKTTLAMKPIPVAAAARIAKQYGYDQVVVIARRVGDGGGEHVTTYGRDEANCGVAARVGNFLKHKIMGWPEFPAADQVIMPREPSARMIGEMEVMTAAMLDAVGKIDVSLIYGTAVQCEIGRLQFVAAGLNDDGSEKA